MLHPNPMSMPCATMCCARNARRWVAAEKAHWKEQLDMFSDTVNHDEALALMQEEDVSSGEGT